MKTLAPWGRWTVRSLRALTLGAAVAGTAHIMTAPGLLAQTPRSARAESALPKKIFTKTSEFKLPVQMEERTRATLDRVCLYVKCGNSDWVRQETGPATLPHFLYRVPQDGEYWFSLTTIDKSGKMSPADVSQEPPALRVVVDTKPPVIEVQPWASPDSDLCLRCTIIDANPDPASLKAVAKMPTGDLPLMPYPGMPGVFRTTSEMATERIVVTASDLSGNHATREVRIRELIGSTLQTAKSPAAPAVSTLPTQPPALPTQSSAQPLTQANPIAPSPSLPTASLPPAPLPAAVSAKTDLPVPKMELPPAPTLPMPETTIVTPAATSVVPPPTPNNNLVVPAAPNLRPEIEHQPRNPGGSQGGSQGASQGGSLPAGNKQVINTTRAVLDYRIDQVGPSGVGKVEVYLTSDQGQTWQKIGEDPDRRSPVEFDLPGEGTFGVRLAITNGNGFGGTAPQRGDQPTCTIEVDTSAPFVQLRPIEPIVANGTLEIRWQATDKNLGPEPVNLYYRSRTDGAWQVIARGLKNDGVYRWAFPRDASAQFYVKLEVTDLAGNTARAETPNAIVLDMTEPHASVVGVSGLSVRTGN